MAIHFYCPLGHRLAVPDERAGKKGRCPECYQRVIVPVADPRASTHAKATSPSAAAKRPSQPAAPVDMIEQLAADMLRKPDGEADDDLSLG